MGAGVCVVVLVWLTALCSYDVRERRLPNWLTVPGAVAVLAFAALTGRALPALAGAAALGGLYLAVHLVAPSAMGAGDVKLAFGVGGIAGYFGVDVWLLAALAAPLLTAGWALIELARRGSRTVPHGPAMCVATATAAALALL
ncbi:MAG: leader peptidase (prepilin peptidase) / N-methyltransferase [Mycobacterium sp.]|jgi:leader peptidase (prepilin peptidase)/N-methyltransferase|nr:leader peptidase (prepilin peptidase) / N-methyltransferase [Mycobacterium sp.]